MLSFRLFVIAESFGALNLYGAAPGAFTDDSITTGEILAQHAAVALAAPPQNNTSRLLLPAATSSARPKASSCTATTSPGHCQLEPT
jgi:hypothetical protein